VPALELPYIKGLRGSIDQELEVLAFGTNAIATSRMLKAGANKGATDENTIVRASHKADLIIGPLAIIMANSMMGELTPKMAEAISASETRKNPDPADTGKHNNYGWQRRSSASPGRSDNTDNKGDTRLFFKPRHCLLTFRGLKSRSTGRRPVCERHAQAGG
jgi:hypothetical protein